MKTVYYLFSEITLSYWLTFEDAQFDDDEKEYEWTSHVKHVFNNYLNIAMVVDDIINFRLTRSLLLCRTNKLFLNFLAMQLFLFFCCSMAHQILLLSHCLRNRAVRKKCNKIKIYWRRTVRLLLHFFSQKKKKISFLDLFFYNTLCFHIYFAFTMLHNIHFQVFLNDDDDSNVRWSI